MVRIPSRVVLVATMLLVVSSVVVAPAFAAQGGGDPVSKNATDETYSIDELSTGGTRVPEIHDGWRPIEGSTSAAWMKYYPTGPSIDTSRGSDDWQYLSPSVTVKRNFIVLTVMRLGDPETRKETFTVAYWNRGERTEKVGNATRTEEFAANQTVEKVQVTLSGRATQVRIPLRPHYDQAKQVTVWMESSDDTARWRFTHHSLKSAQQSATDTRSEDIVAIGKVVGYGAALVLLLGLIGRLLNRRAIVGPMKGMIWWSLVLGGGQLFGVLIGWEWIANTLATNPELLALELGLVGFIQGIESKGYSDTMEAIALRPDVEPAQTATGNDGVSSNGLGFDDARVVTDSKGRHVLVKPGVIRWGIRLLGGRQYLEGTDTIRCTVDVTDGNPEIAYYVDPMSDEVIDRPEPSIGLALPEPSLLQVVAGIGGLYLVGVFAQVAGVGWQSGIAAVSLLAIPAFVDADVPNAVIEPAPAQFGEAHANAMVMAAEYDAVKTVEEAQDALVAQKAKRSVRAERADEERATTLVEETLGADEDAGDDVFDVVDLRDDAEELLGKLTRGGKDDDEGVTIADD